VARILAGSERELTARFRALASHYVFEPVFCRPRTGHDKGGVEARGRSIRWQELVPIPAGDTLGAISADLLARLDARAPEVLERPGEGSPDEPRTIGERFERDRGSMLPLPSYAFVARKSSVAEVSARALVKVEGAHYSVPTAWAGLTVTVRIGPADVEIVAPTILGTDEPRLVTHRRRRFGDRSVDYRHYVSELARKPKAVRQVAPELVRDLGPPFDAAWRLLLDMAGPQDAARHFARILGMVEREGIDVVARAIAAALDRGEPLTGIVLCVPRPPDPTSFVGEIPAALRGVEVLAGCAADYDRWLGDLRAASACEEGGVA
jgi:hypothetical protein